MLRMTWLAAAVVAVAAAAAVPGTASAVPPKVAGFNIAQPLASNPSWVNLALGKSVTASNQYPGDPASQAVDGNWWTYWSAGGYPPQWIEVDLGSVQTVGEIDLGVTQLPDSYTVHDVYGRAGPSQPWTLLHEFAGYTTDQQLLRYVLSKPQGLRYIRIETTQSASWVGWREIEVWGSSPGRTAVVVPRGQPVQIAFAGSSDFPTYTQAFRNAIQMAIAQQPTIRGFPIQINESDPPCFTGDVVAGNVAAATAIVSNPQNAAVLGNVCSTGFTTALPIYQNADLVTLSGSATDPSLPSLGPDVFNRTAVPDPNFDSWYGVVKALPSDLAFQQSYQTEFGAPPLDFTDLNFDAASLLLSDLQRVSRIENGNLVIDRAALASAVRNTTNYQGVTCTVTLDRSTGNRVNDPASLARCAAEPAKPGSTTTHFTASYSGLTCDGERIVKSGPNGGVQDSESCTTPNPQTPDGTYDLTPNPNPRWFSDYEYFVNPGGGCLRPAISGTLVVTDDGHDWSVNAFYDPSFTCL